MEEEEEEEEEVCDQNLKSHGKRFPVQSSFSTPLSAAPNMANQAAGGLGWLAGWLAGWLEGREKINCT